MERSYSGLALGPDIQVTFPVSWYGLILHAGGLFADPRHGVFEARPRLATVSGWAPWGVSLAHEGCDLYCVMSL